MTVTIVLKIPAGFALHIIRDRCQYIYIYNRCKMMIDMF